MLQKSEPIIYHFLWVDNHTFLLSLYIFFLNLCVFITLTALNFLRYMTCNTFIYGRKILFVRGIFRQFFSISVSSVGKRNRWRKNPRRFSEVNWRRKGEEGRKRVILWIVDNHQQESSWKGEKYNNCLPIWIPRHR